MVIDPTTDFNISGKNFLSILSKKYGMRKTITGMIVIAQEPTRHSNCSIWDGKWNCQAMRCRAPKMVVTMKKIRWRADRTRGA